MVALSENDISLRWVLSMCGICILGIFSFGVGLDSMGAFDEPSVQTQVEQQVADWNTRLDRIQQSQDEMHADLDVMIEQLEKLNGSEENNSAGRSDVPSL